MENSLGLMNEPISVPSLCPSFPDGLGEAHHAVDTECWACGGEKFKVKLSNTLVGKKKKLLPALRCFGIMKSPVTFFVPAPSSLRLSPSLPNPTFSI